MLFLLKFVKIVFISFLVFSIVFLDSFSVFASSDVSHPSDDYNFEFPYPIYDVGVEPDFDSVVSYCSDNGLLRKYYFISFNGSRYSIITSDNLISYLFDNNSFIPVDYSSVGVLSNKFQSSTISSWRVLGSSNLFSVQPTFSIFLYSDSSVYSSSNFSNHRSSSDDSLVDFYENFGFKMVDIDGIYYTYLFPCVSNFPLHCYTSDCLNDVIICSSDFFHVTQLLNHHLNHQMFPVLIPVGILVLCLMVSVILLRKFGTAL